MEVKPPENILTKSTPMVDSLILMELKMLLFFSKEMEEFSVVEEEG
jgi:hypothetical protein